MRMMSRNSMSEQLQEKIDSAVRRFSEEGYQVALAHIRDCREAMDKIVEVLNEKETMDGEEFRELLARYVTIPEENLKAAQIQAAQIAKEKEDKATEPVAA